MKDQSPESFRITTGAVVPNAKVTLLNTDQGLTLETTTDSSGVYTFSPVRIGHYSMYRHGSWLLDDHPAESDRDRESEPACQY